MSDRVFCGVCFESTRIYRGEESRIKTREAQEMCTHTLVEKCGSHRQVRDWSPGYTSCRCGAVQKKKGRLEDGSI